MSVFAETISGSKSTLIDVHHHFVPPFYAAENRDRIAAAGGAAGRPQRPTPMFGNGPGVSETKFRSVTYITDAADARHSVVEGQRNKVIAFLVNPHGGERHEQTERRSEENHFPELGLGVERVLIPWADAKQWGIDAMPWIVRHQSTFQGRQTSTGRD
jgi:hypothetical protein